jgi:hypothetical protein
MRRAAAVLLLTLGCASNHYDTYKARNPDWYGEGPTVGASLHETLAVLHAPAVGGNRRLVSKLDVLRFDAGAAVVLSETQLEAALADAAPSDYGVMATLTCRSKVDLEIFTNQKVAWYLLVGGKLEAWDHYDFTDRCVSFDDLRPARGDAPRELELERLLVAHRDAHFPRSMEHVAELYQKGIRYLAVGRTQDAAAMLEAGDRGFDVGARGARHVDFENAPPQLRLAQSPEIEALRQQLVQGLARAGVVPAHGATSTP